MATLLGTLGVRLTAATGTFVKGMKGAAGSINKTAAAMRSMTAMSTVAFGGLAGAIGLATKALGEQREAEARLAAVAGVQGLNVQALKNYAAELQKVTTFGDETTISAMAMLGSFRLTGNQIKTLIPRVQNLAAFMGTSLNSAALQIGKAFSMGAGSLSRMGIVLTEAQKKAFNAAGQLGKVAILAKAIDDNAGKAAETIAKTTVGAFKQMSNAAGDTLEELGKLVEVPLAAVFRTVTSVIESVTAALDGLSSRTKALLGGAALAATAIAGLVAVVGTLALVLTTAVAVPIAIAVAALAGLVVIVGAVVVASHALRAAWETDFLGMRTAVDKATEWFSARMKWFGGVWDKITDGLAVAWEWLTDLMGSQWETVTKYWVDTFKSATKGIFKLINDIVAELRFMGVISKKTADDWRVDYDKAGDFVIKAFKGAKNAAKKALGGISEFAGEAFTSLKDTGVEAADLLGDAWTEMLDGIIAALGLTGEAAEELKRKAGAPAGGAGAGGGAKTGDQEGLMDIFTRNVGEMFAGAGEQVAGAMAIAAGAFADTLKQAAPRIGAIMEGAIQGFKTGNVWGAVIGAIAAFVSSLEGFQKIMMILESSLDPVVELFEGFFDAIIPVVEAFTDIIKPLTELGGGFAILKTLFTILGAVLKPFADIMRQVAFQMEQVIKWIEIAFEDMLFEIGKFFRGWADSIANELQKAKIQRMMDTRARRERKAERREGERAAAQETGGDGTSLTVRGAHEAFEAARAAADAAARDAANPINDLGEAAGEAASSFKQATASLMGVPRGFKIAAARLAAIGTGGAVGGLATQTAGDPGGADGGGRLFQIGSVYVQADDPREFMERLEMEAEWQNFTSDGTPIPTGPDPNKR